MKTKVKNKPKRKLPQRGKATPGVGKDAYGYLNREVLPPKGAILVQLRRVLPVAETRCHVVADWRDRIEEAEVALANAPTEADRKVARKRLQKAHASLVYAEQRRDYSLRRLVVLIDAARTRSLTRKAVRTLKGAQGMEAIQTLIDRAQTVVDVVTVREKLSGRDDAFVRLSTVARRIASRLIYQAVHTGLMTEDDAKAKADAAVLDAAEQWQWNHASGNRFTSYAFSKIMRSLQIRTRADRPIMSVQRADGSWSQAGSLDGLGMEDASREFTPHAVSHHEMFTSPSSQARESDVKFGIMTDVTNAIARLDATDQEIARGLFLRGEKLSEVSARLGVSDTLVKGRRAVILDALRDSLAVYQTGDL